MGVCAVAMNQQDTALLQAQARRFRAVIEQLDKCLLPLSFEAFPRGSCGDAALLLGTYLSELGFGEFTYVCGQCRDSKGPDKLASHAWLVSADGTIVDITADQFPDVTEPVIVSKSSEWHARWETTSNSRADYRGYDGPSMHSLDAAYRLIKSALDTSHP